MRLELVPTTADGWPDEARILERLADPRVRVLAVSLRAVQPAGTRRPRRALRGDPPHRRQYLVVDAIQGVGQVPFDLSRTQVDVLVVRCPEVAPLPLGIGLRLRAAGADSAARVPVTGWMAFEGTDDFHQLTSYHDTLRGDARRFELITLPYQDFAGMNASLGLVHELGVARIARTPPCPACAVVSWADRTGVRVTSPRGARGSGIVCVAPPQVERVYRALKAARIICSLREGAIRLSPHSYNTVSEMERAVEVLDGESGGR